MLRNTVDPSRFTKTALEAALAEVTYEDLIEFKQSMWQNISIKGLSYGNISKDMSLEFVNRVCDALKCTFVAEPAEAPSIRLKEDVPTHTIYSLISKNEGCNYLPTSQPFFLFHLV